ncbi:ribosomal RNA processing protein 1 homolog [Leptopilina boulardi]|uniref:ribosomal RNA processing protein 1 homolog n=1 Tax=Leptopilina boulardi TaxID=63433 RepID=UPI0021F576BB|nr:ribosomal RNA processing protein 1 homolog [Leptopilina boulardi]
MGIKKPTRCTTVSSKQKKKKQIPKCNMQQKVSNVKQEKSGKALIIAQEIKFARLLASKDKKVRDKVLKNLKKWLTVRAQSSFAFTEADFVRLWKGLYYCMWMSDKPLVQEELAESISKIVHCFSSMKTALLYVKCTFESLSTEWFGIDRYRIDKFEMLLRRIIRQTFEMCKKHEWNKELIVEFAKILQAFLVATENSLGLKLQIVEVFMEELAKVSNGLINEDIVTELVRPFAVYLSSIDDARQMRHIVKNIFRYLIFQSNIGMDYLEKFDAWRKAGFPCGVIDVMKKVELSDSETDLNNISHSSDEEIAAGPSDGPLDPRAGRVDVEIPQLPFDPQEITNLLLEYRFIPSSTTKSRRQIVRLAKEFTLMANGEMPIGVKEIQVPLKKKSINKKAALNLLQFEEELYLDSNKALRKRKRKNDDDDDDEDEDDEDEDEEETVSEIKSVNGKDKNLTTEKIINKKHKMENTEASSSNVKSKKKEKVTNSDAIIVNGKLKKKKHKKKNKVSEFGTCGDWDVSSAEPEESLNFEEIQRKQNSIALSVLTESLKNSKLPTLRPVLTKLEDQNGKLGCFDVKANFTPNKKRVKIMLQKNTAQHTSEYFQQIRQSPAIPYDANRKPRAGVLKPSPLPSPINPFYNKKNR